jgi:drug/metabolite transporter (DMT)-like permease
LKSARRGSTAAPDLPFRCRPFHGHRHRVSAQVKLTAEFWVILTAISVFWGSTFAANRTALEELDGWTILGLRSLFSAALLWVVVKLRGHPVPRSPRVWLKLSLLGVMAMLLPHILVLWGQIYVPSALAGILNASVAPFTVAFAAGCLPDERLTPRRTVGIALSLLGVIVAAGAGNLLALDLGSAGQLAIVLGAAIYASSTVIARLCIRGIPSEVTAAIFFTITTLLSLPIAVVAQGVPSLALRPQTWAALGFLVLFASVGAYLIVYRYLPRYGASNINLANLLTGPVAVLLGSWLFDESLPAHAYAGFAILGLGLLAIDGRIVAFFACSRDGDHDST